MEHTKIISVFFRLLTKAQHDLEMWKRKCESGEGGVRQDEYDDMKRKFLARIEDTESQIESCIGKIHTLEKQRNKMSGELEDLMIEVERSVFNTH